MNLYNVKVQASYDTGYYGDVDTSYNELVIAASKKDAIDFVNSKIEHMNSSYKKAVATDADEINMLEVERAKTATLTRFFKSQTRFE